MAASLLAAAVSAACGSIPGLQSATDTGSATGTSQGTTVAVRPAAAATATKPSSSSRANASQAVQVKRDSITETASLDGIVSPADQVTITYPTRGTVDDVRVKAGQSVNKGDILVDFNAGDLSKSVAEARGKLQASKQALTQGQAAAEAAAAKAAQTEVQRQQVVLDAETAVQRAQENLAHVQAGRPASERQAQQAALSYGQAQMQEAQNALSKLMAGPDENTVRAAQREVAADELAVNQAQAELDKLTRGADPEAIRAGEAAVQRATLQLQIAQNAKPDPRVDASAAKLQHDAGVQDAQNALQSAQTALMKLKTPPSTLDVRSAQQKVQAAQDALTAARAKVDSLQNGPDPAAIAAAKTNIEHIKQYIGGAQASLDEVMSHPTPAELADAQDGLRKAQAALESAQRGTGGDAAAVNLDALQAAVKQDQTDLSRLELALANTHLTAPFDGMVVSVKVKIGESVSTGKPIVILAKPGAPVIHADLSDVDPTRVATGQPARVELDTGKGQPQTFDATVSDVTAVGADSSAGPSATFQVTWADGQTPKFGSVVVVTLDLQRKDGVLVVPSNAIRHSGGRTVVEVQDGNLRRLVPIQVGITGLDRVEVVGGLNEGQMVLVGPS